MDFYDDIVDNYSDGMSPEDTVIIKTVFKSCPTITTLSDDGIEMLAQILAQTNDPDF